MPTLGGLPHSTVNLVVSGERCLDSHTHSRIDEGEVSSVCLCRYLDGSYVYVLLDQLKYEISF